MARPRRPRPLLPVPLLPVALLLGLGGLFAAWTLSGPSADPAPHPRSAPRSSAAEPTPEAEVVASTRAVARAPAEAPGVDLPSEPAPAPAVPLFHGRVVDDHDGSPVGGARVRLASTGDDRPAVSDDDGRFTLRLPDDEARPALVEAAGYGRLLFAADPATGDADVPAELRLRRGGALRARVTAAGGGGLPGVEVVLRAEASELVRVEGQLVNPFVLDDEAWTAVTDGSGEAFFADLATGASLRVELRGDGRTLQKPAQPIVLSPGEEAEREFVVGAGATILGHVRDEAGVPVAGAEVWRLRGVKDMVTVLRPDQRSSVLQKATTDELGAFELADVPVGTWWVGVAPSDDIAADAATLAVTPQTFFPQVELVVHRGLFLRGAVVGPDGAVAFAQVQARQTEGRLVYYSGFAREGAFELGPLVPGTYTIGAGADGLIGPEVTAEAGDEHVVLALTAGAVLRGRVVDAATGEPVRASVRAQETSAEHTFDSIGRPPEVGTEFAFGNLRPVAYGLVARTADGRVGVLRAMAEPGGSAAVHELRVAPGATLELEVRAGSGRGFLGLWLDDVMLFGNGLQEGDRLDVPVPAGELLLVWRPSGGQPIERHVAGAAGARVEVVLGDG